MKRKLRLDGTKLIYHVNRLNTWKRGGHIFPVYVEISPIGFCNQKCLFCAYEYLTKVSNTLDTERMIAILDEFSRLGVKSVFYSGEGEPLLHPDITVLIQHTHRLGIDCALNTNGMLLTEEISRKVLKDLAWVRFSINAGNEASYRKIHSAKKGDFNRLIRNLEDAVGVKRKKKLNVSLGVQLVYIKQPFDEVRELAVLLKKKGLDYFAIKQFNKHPLSDFDVTISSRDIERLKTVERLSDDNFYVTVREGFDAGGQVREYKKCFGFDFFAEIKCDGGVYPCGPLLGITRYCYGNIYQATFKDIWMAKQRAQVVDEIYSKIDISQCMPNCRLHNVNDFLWKFKESPAHVNFI